MGWHEVPGAEALQPGEMMGALVAETPIALYNIDGEFFATHNICTHAYACLTDGYLDDDKIECPLHQGLFDVRTGKAEDGPVDEDLKTYPVRKDGATILVQVDP